MIIILIWIATATYVLHKLEASNMLVPESAERDTMLNRIVGEYDVLQFP